MKLTFLLAGVVITGLIIISTGCSPTGWATRDVPTGSNLDKGDIVTIIQKDGTQLTGEYEGMVNLPFTEYSTAYNSQVLQDYDGRILPAIGQRIEVTTSLTDTKSWKGQFLGFDDQNLWLKEDGNPEPSKFYISSLTSFSSRDGKVFRSMMFRDIFLSGDVPLMSVFEVKTDSGTLQVPYSSVGKITAVASLPRVNIDVSMTDSLPRGGDAK